MFSLEKRRLRGDLRTGFRDVKGGYKGDRDQLVSMATEGKRRNMGGT